MNSSASEIGKDTVFQHSQQVAYREVDGEILIVPIRMSVKDPSGIYRLNRTASFIWKNINGERSVQDIINQVVQQFEVDSLLAMTDTHTLLADLLSFNALLPVSSK